MKNHINSKKTLFFFFHIILFFCIIACSDKENVVLNPDLNKLHINYTVKNNNNLKSAREIDIIKGELLIKDSANREITYSTSKTHTSSIEFLIPTDKEDYTIKELFLYDSDGRRRLYLEKEIKVNNSNRDINNIVLTEIIESYWFNWEAATYVSNDNKLPRLPWISGASTGVPRKISLDHKREDGWELIHNSFTLISGNSEPRNKYLLFYNKYTGFLRMWYWHEGANSYSSLKYSIQHLSNLSILNFNGDFALPMNHRFPGYSEFISGDESIQSSQGIMQFAWYMFEYEIAYDNKVQNLSSNNSDLFIAARGVNFSTLKLNGSQTGKIDGKIVLNSSSSNLFNINTLNYNNTNSTNSNNNNITSTNVTTRNSTNWWQQVKGNLTKKTADQIGNAGGNLASNILNLVTNPIGKYLNSLVHQNTANQSSVNLSMSTKIELTGTLTNEAPVLNLNLHLPGINTETGLKYLYNKPLGVFNLDTHPVVNYQQTYFHKGTATPRYFQYFTIDKIVLNL